jgi:predicted O-methyltransferase YrrM
MYFERFQTESAEVPGFVLPESIAIWDFFLSEQQKEQVTGALMEIGVYYGKSAIMLAMQALPEKQLVLIDFSDFVDHAAATIHKLKSENVQIIKEKSSSAACWALTKRQKRSFRWIHVDGDHKAKTVANDLRLASRLLADEGIICVDDFFNPRYPQLTYAVTEFLLRERSKFNMFLCGFNKAYIARVRYHQKFLSLVRTGLADWLHARGFSDFTIFKTDLAGRCNSFGIGPRWQEYAYYGLDEDPARIVY